jgi:acyl-CoA thioester hydrolase
MGSPPRAADFPHHLAIPTRWADNDVYGHVNNVVHYAFFDTAINHFLIEEGGLDIHDGAVIGVCAESHCHYHGSLTFPEVVHAGLRVGNLGRSSVRYELGLFSTGAEEAAAEGWFVHVFVDRASRRPVPVPEALRRALERLT